MQESQGFALPSTTLLVEVGVAPYLAEIHTEFAPLLRLSGICAVPSTVTSASAVISGGVGAIKVSGSDDEELRNGRRSPAMSPVRAAESKLVELTAPVRVKLPLLVPDEDSALIAHYIQSFNAHEEAERAYVAFIFGEYKKRKSIDQKRLNEMEAMRQELEALLQRELPPEVRAALDNLVKNESAAREAVWAAYRNFLEWIASTTPQWIEAACRQEQARLADEKARRAAMAAAREALTQELLMGKRLSEESATTSGGGTGATFSPRASTAVTPGASAGVVSAAVVTEDGSLSYEPAVPVDQHSEVSENLTAPLAPSELRRKAIRMLEVEEERMRHRREEQVRLLRVQEEQLRAEISLKKQHEAEQAARKEREAAQRHEDDMAQRYNALLEQEFTLQNRVREREEEKAKREAERRMLMEHVAAEEQLLRQRIQEKEDRRKASEEETARVTREKKMREICEQEEALRRRIAEREATAEAEKRAQENKARREAEEAVICAQQEEALRQAKAEREKMEKARQLAYLRDQEEACKRHIREKELAEIEARGRAAETYWTSRASNHSLSTASPMPTGSMTMPAPHVPTYPQLSTPASYFAVSQSAVPPVAAAAYAPPVPPAVLITAGVNGGGYYNANCCAAPAPVMPPLPPLGHQMPYTAFHTPHAGHPTDMPQQQPLPTSQVTALPGYPTNPAAYYPQVVPPGMMLLQSSPYAPATMYQR